MSDPAPGSPQPPPQRRLFRDLVVFQGKLFLDGLRDVALSPASLLLALIDALSGDRSGNRFYRLLSLGKRSDHWINLFGAADNRADAPLDTAQDPEHPAPANDRAANVDDVVQRVEGLVREQYRNGSMSDSARRAISRGLDSLRARRRPGDVDARPNNADAHSTPAPEQDSNEPSNEPSSDR